MLEESLNRFGQVRPFAEPLRLLRNYLSTIPGHLLLDSNQLKEDEKAKLGLAIQRILIPACLNNLEDHENHKNQLLFVDNPFAFEQENFDWERLSFGHYLEINGATDGFSGGMQRDQVGINVAGEKIDVLPFESFLGQLVLLQTQLAGITSATQNLQSVNLDEETFCQHDLNVTQNLCRALGILENLNEFAEQTRLKLNEEGVLRYGNEFNIREEKLANKQLFQFIFRLRTELSYHLCGAKQKTAIYYATNPNVLGIGVANKVKEFTKKNQKTKNLHDALIGELENIIGKLTQEIQIFETTSSEERSNRENILALQAQLEKEILTQGQKQLLDKVDEYSGLLIELDEIKANASRNKIVKGEDVFEREIEGLSSEQSRANIIEVQLKNIENDVLKKGKKSEKVKPLQKELSEKMQLLNVLQQDKCHEIFPDNINTVQKVLYGLLEVQFDLQKLFSINECNFSQTYLEQQIHCIFHRLITLKQQAQMLSNTIEIDDKHKDDNLSTPKSFTVENCIQNLLDKFNTHFNVKTAGYLENKKQKKLISDVLGIKAKTKGKYKKIAEIVNEVNKNSNKNENEPDYQKIFLKNLNAFRNGYVNECQFYSELKILHDQYAAKSIGDYFSIKNWFNGKVKQFIAMRSVMSFVNCFVKQYGDYQKKHSISEIYEIENTKKIVLPQLNKLKIAVSEIQTPIPAITEKLDYITEKFTQTNKNNLRQLKIGSVEECAALALQMQLVNNMFELELIATQNKGVGYVA